METSILLVGLATDGPSYEAYTPPSIADLYDTFGGNYAENFTLSSSATSVTLEYEPLFTPTNTVGLRSQYLFSPTLSGTTYMFGSVGGTGAQIEVIYTPYLGKEDLLFAARSIYEATGVMPSVIRAGGTHASGTVGDFHFTALYAGAKYNNINIEYDGTTLTISGLEPKFKSRSFTVPYDKWEAVINREARVGFLPVFVTKQGSSNPGTFSVTLSGGSDGTLNAATMAKLLSMSWVPTSVSHIVYLSPLVSSFVAEVDAHLIKEGAQPRMFWFPSPDYSKPTGTWISQQATDIPYRHPMIASFVGDSNHPAGDVFKDRYLVEAAAAGYIANRKENITNMALPSSFVFPLLSETELKELKLYGWNGATRRIMRELSIFEGVPSTNTASFQYSSKSAEVCALSSSYLAKYLGKLMPPGIQNTISKGLKEFLNQQTYHKVDNVQIAVYRDLMNVKIDVVVPDEILSIQFNINTRKAI